MAALEQIGQKYLDFEWSEYLAKMKDTPLTNALKAIKKLDSDNKIDIARPPTKKLWNINLHPTNTYTNIPWIKYPEPWIEENEKENVPLTAEKWTVTYKNARVIPQKGIPYRATHKETYYTDQCKDFATKNIEWRIRSILNEDRKRKNLPEIPKDKKVIQYAKDGTIRDIEGYIIVAANLNTYKRGTVVMTSLGPGRVYDTGKLGADHFDIYTHRPTLKQLRNKKKAIKKHK